MTIVVGLTTAPESGAALDAAIAEAHRCQGSLLLINATRGDSLVDEKFIPPEGIDALRERLTEEGIKHEIRQIVSPHDPAEEILAAAADAELIVIGLRRRTSIGKFILGSTSQQVLLNVDVPVLSVKAPDKPHHHWWQRPH